LAKRFQALFKKKKSRLVFCLNVFQSHIQLPISVSQRDAALDSRFIQIRNCIFFRVIIPFTEEVQWSTPCGPLKHALFSLYLSILSNMCFLTLMFNLWHNFRLCSTEMVSRNNPSPALSMRILGPRNGREAI
jgi:hypothetical protein